MNSRKSSTWSSWQSRGILMWTIYQHTRSTMFLKQRSSVLTAARHLYRPLYLPPPCLLLWSPSPWSLPTLQVHPLCRSPLSLLQLLHHLPLLCHALHNPDLTIPTPYWPSTTSSWYRTTLLTYSSSPKLIIQTYSSIHSSRWFSTILVLSSHLPNNTPYFPIRAPCSSRLLYRMVPSAGGVLLMTGAT